MDINRYTGLVNREVDIGVFDNVDDYDRHRLLFYKIHHYLIDKCVSYEPDKYEIQDCGWGFHSYVTTGEKTMKETIVEGFDLVYNTEVTDEDYEEAYERFKHLLDIKRFPQTVVDWAEYIVKNNIKNEYSSNREIFTKCVRQECEIIMDILSLPIPSLDDIDDYWYGLCEDCKYGETWSDITLWFNGVGVEYNFCVDGNENCSAFYLMFNTELDKENEYYDGYYIYTLYDYCEHYEVDFADPDRKKNAKIGAYNAMLSMIDEKKITESGYVYI